MKPRPSPESIPGQDAWGWIAALIAGIPGRLRYRKGATGVETTAAAALARGEGVCQDFAHLALGLLSSAGIPARYVGGYQYLGIDAQYDPHAWIEVWHPAGIWVGFDPTSGARADERYVRVAVGRDYTDAAPLRGHVMFAAPPRADTSPAPPEVEVAIVRVSSPDQPLGFTPEGPDLSAAPGAVAHRPPEGATRREGV